MPSELVKCYKILSSLKVHPKSHPFLEPVNPEKLNIPDYFNIVKEPIDLGTIEKKLLDGIYLNSESFANDVRKVWSNSLLYNPSFSNIYNMTLEISKYFENLFKEKMSEKKMANVLFLLFFFFNL